SRRRSKRFARTCRSFATPPGTRASGGWPATGAPSPLGRATRRSSRWGAWDGGPWERAARVREAVVIERLLVCGIGSGMDHSLPELRSPRRELVVVTDRPTAQARAAADTLLVCDPTDATAVLAELAAAGIDRLDGVLSLGSDNPPVISVLAHRFGCPGLPLETALDCTLKDRRLAILREAGLDLPRFATAESVAEALRAVAEVGL